MPRPISPVWIFRFRIWCSEIATHHHVSLWRPVKPLLLRFRIRTWKTIFSTYHTRSEDHEFMYVAARAANGLLHCAMEKTYINQSADEAVIAFDINPLIKDFILNPGLLGQPTFLLFPTTTMYRSPSTSSNSNSSYNTATNDSSPIIMEPSVAIVCLKRRNQQKKQDYRPAIRKMVPENLIGYYEIPRWSVGLRDVCLGTGQYGTVYKGVLLDNKSRKAQLSRLSESRSVAVKMMREQHPDGHMHSGFLQEIGILMRVGRHVNIVNLEGLVLKGKLLMIMEYCDLGSLESYLRKIRAEGCDIQSIDITELISIAYQISRGMEFLSSKNVIHRDLAARNILLNASKTVKIADFGMAREQPEYILEREKVPLPVCWMAPESIIPGRGIFTTLSDVWSFGVVLWEIFSLGGAPYASEFPTGIWYSQFCLFLQEGQRLHTPELCPESIATLMTACWHFHAEDRPHFSSLRQSIETLLSMAERTRFIGPDTENETLNDCLNIPINCSSPSGIVPVPAHSSPGSDTSSQIVVMI
ncbi:fibroblast growth factor receptor-like [Paramacrobiotus metropolitanus]|uniref:fibroblast growth factor receptor-like n=1 Tax=Paramacrobiotus metropolitanus TaxID=2943436 RepID=UPI002445D9F4|nr:fibroblast growth factor receptor-like [Paramacrobiotus metropolitanus]